MTKKVTMAAATAGRAEGGTTLNAFDNALLAAGIGNINLIKVSSILPLTSRSSISPRSSRAPSSRPPTRP